MNVRYRCMGCGHNIDPTEHARNLTIEKLSQDVPGLGAVTSTMTVILCDACKPEYDALTQAQERPPADTFDVLVLVEQMRDGKKLDALDEDQVHTFFTGTED